MKYRSYFFALPFLIVLALGVILRVYNLNNVAARSPDEMVYTHQANVINGKGVSGIRSMVREFNQNEKLWLYPPPVRVGYLGLLAGVMKVAKKADVAVGSYISCAFSIVSLLLLILIGIRFFNLWAALFALIFAAVSPMALAIARRTWQDSLIGCLGLALIYLACEITRNSRGVIRYVLFAAIGSYLITIKASGVLIYGLCVLWIFWILFVRERSFAKGSIFTAGVALGAGVSIFIVANAVGGIGPFIDVMKHMKSAMAVNSYAIEYQTGPWYQFLGGFWIISPANALLCPIGMMGVVRSEKKDKHALLGMIFFMMIFMLIALNMPHGQNFRRLSVLYAPFYLMGGMGFWYIVSFLAKFREKGMLFYALAPFIMMAVLAGAARDYRSFKKIFIRTGIKDVSIRMLKECSR